jgi:hypothetical protein
MENPVKLSALGTKDENKQNKNAGEDIIGNTGQL